MIPNNNEALAASNANCHSSEIRGCSHDETGSAMVRAFPCISMHSTRLGQIKRTITHRSVDVEKTENGMRKIVMRNGPVL